MAQTLRAGSVIFLCMLLGVAAVTAGVSPVAAQDDDGELPSLPANYHGELTIAGGSVDVPVMIEAVADGEVQDTIRTDADGTIGSAAAGGDKLEVQEPDDENVEFQIAGSPVTIVSVDGEPVNSNTISFDSGVQEIVLEATPEDIAPTVDLDISDAPDTIDAGERVAVEVDIENTGAVAVDDDVELADFDGTIVDTEAIDLDVGDSTTTTLTWDTADTDAGDGNLTIQAGETTATHALVIEEVTPPVVAQPSPGGAGDGDDADLPDGVVGVDEQTIVNDEDVGISQVRFTSATDVESVTWNQPDINGTVTATTFAEAPNETSPAPGALISVSQISVPDNAQNEPATVQFMLNTSQLDTVDASADELTVFHFADGEWAPLETEIIETDDANEVLVQTETEGFSYFAVSATSEPTAEFTMDPAEPEADTPISLDASASTTEYGDIVSYDWAINGDTASGETVETTLPDTDSVEIELTVENDAGLTDTTTQSVSLDSADDSDDGDAETDDGIPGFTILVTLLAVLLSVAALRYRL